MERSSPGAGRPPPGAAAARHDRGDGGGGGGDGGSPAAAQRPSPLEGDGTGVDILLDDDAGDLEAPLLADDVLHAPPTSPRAAPIWPALRLSSITTRKLSPQMGIDASGGQMFSPSRASPRGRAPWQQPPPPLAPPPAGGAPRAAPKPPKEARGPRVVRAAVAGVLNSVIALPVMLSFATIIFRDSFFREHLSSLIKLVFLSSALHQLAFLRSSMPFAVGQVQDVGLIFLSAIASGVVDECERAGVGAADTLGTVLAALAAATALVGGLIVATGRLRLASIVQYCPLPVVGGYLSYVGFFVLCSGVSLASGVAVTTPRSWTGLADTEALLRLLPAVAMAGLLTLVLRRCRSPYALPALLLAVPLAFYGLLAAGGWTLEDARRGGWVAQPQPDDSDWRFWRMYELYNVHSLPPSNLHWRALPPQAGKLLALYFVVAFGSSMDIAAIQAGVPDDLDYNTELQTVGVSNLVVGLAGVGFTGSYVFSQTLFSLRLGVDSPVMGAIIAAAELAVFALPLSPLTLLPNFFFGALVMWIGVDILKDWLFVSFRRVALVEYALLVFTFAAVLAMGLEAGIAAGVAASALHFAVEYARLSVRTFAVVPSRSGAVRSFEQRTVLEAFAGRVAAVALSGMVFFGSATKVAEQALAVAAAVLQTQPHLGDDSRDDEAGAAPQGGTAPPRGMRPVPSQRTLCATYDHFEALTASGGLEGAGAALQEAPLVLLLDLTRVHGIDATAARTFATLHTRLARRGVRLALTGLRADEAGARMRRVLVGQGLILEAPTDAAAPPGPGFLGPAAAAAAPAPTCAWFESMDAGLCWCEEQFLDVAVRRGLCRPRPDRVSLAEVLRSNLELPRLLLGPAPVDYAAAAARLEQFCARREVAAGEAVFERGEAANDVYIVERGTVACHIDFLATTVHSRAAAAAVPGMAAVRPARVLRFGPGGIVGDLDFMLQRPRSYSAVCERAAVAWVLPRAGFERLAAEAPQVLVLLQTVMLRLNCLSATHALAALESTAA